MRNNRSNQEETESERIERLSNTALKVSIATLIFSILTALKVFLGA